MCLVCLQLLCLVGEAFGEDNDTVNGAVVNIRGKGDKIALWTHKADEQDSIMRIGWVVFYIMLEWDECKYNVMGGGRLS